MAAAHYRKEWVLLSNPEFRMAPGNPNFRPSPYPNVVMYPKLSAPRNNAPGYDGGPSRPNVHYSEHPPAAAPAASTRRPQGLSEDQETNMSGVPVRRGFQTQSGNPVPAAPGRDFATPRAHGLTYSGETSSAVPQRIHSTVKISAMSVTAPDLRARREENQAARRSEIVDTRRYTGPPSQASYDELVRQGQILVARRDTKRARQDTFTDAVSRKR